MMMRAILSVALLIAIWLETRFITVTLSFALVMVACELIVWNLDNMRAAVIRLIQVTPGYKFKPGEVDNDRDY